MKQKNKHIIYSELSLRNNPYTNLIVGSSQVFHTHTFWEFAISNRGECINHIGGQDIRINSGNCFLMRPDDLHNIDDFTNGHTHRDVYVSDEKMRKICSIISADLYDKLHSGEYVVNFYMPKGILDKIILDLDYLANRQGIRNEGDEQFHSAVVCLILSTWYTSFHNKQGMPKFLITLLEQINSGAFMDKSVEEISRYTNFSHGYLCRVFRKYVGISLSEYVRKFKLNYAWSLLANSELSIIDIANMLNYDVPSSFTNAFKRKFGKSPQQVRQELLQKNRK